MNAAGAGSIALTTPVGLLPLATPRRTERLAGLGIRCVADLLRHLPLRYEHERPEETIADAGRLLGPRHGAHANVAVRGEILAMRLHRGRKPRVEATLSDGSATLKLTWFNAPWVRRTIHPGARVLVQGRMERHGDWLQMVNPKLSRLEGERELPRRDERFRPVYPASEELASAEIERMIAALLPAALPLIEDHLPKPYREARGMPPLAEAYRMIHQPEELDDALAGRRRLAFDELLLQQLAVMTRRRQLRESMRAAALPSTPTIDRHILARFPFALTADQRLVIDEIAADLGSSTPMNRLLQGDVGAGKTVVALYAMLLATASGHQSLLMAPTELLAEQHHASIGRFLGGSAVRLALLTGSAGRSEREAILAAAADGTIDILVGTHALLGEALRFRSLALAVIDEQHRFGVHQRAVFRSRAGALTSTDAAAAALDGSTSKTERSLGPTVPHVLVMTATPIPRTLSLTIFGDLDVSTIRSLPPGRTPTVTRVVDPDRAADVYAYVAERVAAGEQAYVVVPAVEEGDLGLANVAGHLEWLAKGPLANARLAGLHGRMRREERDAIMTRFREGAVDALVSTVVIEVGVDVPNASIMVVEHADRFGLAQLHQLRGRVGRGTRRSLCVLLARPLTPDAEARLQAIAETSDGFRIAERDLEIRGPGDLFGARQHGVAPFIAAELPRDFQLLALARRDAEAWIARSPDLSAPEEALLRRRMLKAHGATLGVGDVG
ncbi:MAG TPA: ATP-dependent DNA helicase RecG [Phycisphaerales bacterium]|nr:ATP-dependent DNA helicase RecG [Phycisphaerales bacterium]HMP36658.1 ATP-dependent DNA helicase RecG [Phycisphaerales bacterium]